jgi:CBS domain-containing protein
MRRTEYLTEQRLFAAMRAELLMEHDVVSCRSDDTARHAASQLSKFNFGGLPVMDDGRLVGMVTEYDLLQALRDGFELGKTPVEAIMSRDVVTIQADAPAEEIVKLLQDRHLIRVPVLRGDKLVGIVARRDLLFGYIRATAEYWP